MDISNIPKTFWHALSVAVLALTFGLVAIAWRSQSVTIEIANTKVALSKAITDTREANQELAAKAEALDRAAKAYQVKYDGLKKMLATRPASLKPNELERFRPGKLELPGRKLSPESFRDTGDRLRVLQTDVARK